MADKPKNTKELIAAHEKLAAGTRKIIAETKQLVSHLKEDIECHEKLLVQQLKELDKLLDDLKTERD